MRKTVRHDIKQLLNIATPLVAAFLAQMGMEVVDTLMMGRLGPKALAAGALGSVAFITLLVLCIGITSAVGILIARHVGSKNTKAITATLYQGLYLVLLVSAPCMLMLWWLNHFYLAIHQDPEIVAMTREFLRTLLWGFPGALFIITLREFLSAMFKARIVMIVAVCAIPINAIGNYIFMYGKLGLPAMGIAGIGTASAIVEWGGALALLIYIFQQPQLKRLISDRLHRQFDWAIIKEIYHLGWPVGVLMGFEVGMFSVATVLIGYFGTYALAAHQIALQCASVAFMFPMGIAQATGIRVGHAMGANQPRRAKRAANIGLAIGLFVAIFTAAFFTLAPNFLINLFIESHHAGNQEVVSIGVKMLGIAGIFQFLDAIQVIASGALRGYKDTFVPMLIGLLSYWIVGLSAAYVFGFAMQSQGVGVWWGLAIGIGASGSLLYWRLFRTMHK